MGSGAVAVYLDDRLFGHPKIRRLGDLIKPYGRARGFMFYAASVNYCRAYLTDGLVPVDFVTSYVDDPSPGRLADGLCAVELWHREPGGYRIHDFHDWNDPAETVKRQRAATRERVARWRARGGNGRV